MRLMPRTGSYSEALLRSRNSFEVKNTSELCSGGIFIFLLFILLSQLVFAVDWRDYSVETFNYANISQVPVFMVISSSWCEDCAKYKQILSHRSVGRLISDDFVPVYVDADKRVDLYREFGGGLPNTVIFSPDGDEVLRLSGLIDAGELASYLIRVRDFFDENGVPVRANISDISRVKRIPSRESLEGELRQFREYVRAVYDEAHGGFGSEEKWHQSFVLLYLLDEYSASNNSVDIQMVEETLGAISEKDNYKGLTAQDGGFYSRTRNREWGMPYREKRLEPNVQVTSAFLRAYQVTGDRNYLGSALYGLYFLEFSLLDDKGAFYSSVPGKYDRVVIASDQAQAISLFFFAGEVLNDSYYTNISLKALEFAEGMISSETGVFHAVVNGSVFLSGLLVDNAWMAIALLDAHRVTGNPKYLQSAKSILKVMLTRLYDSEVGAFYERNSTWAEYYRGDEFSGFLPVDGNVVAALAFVKAHDRTGTQGYLDVAKLVLGFLQGRSAGLSNDALKMQVLSYVVENYPNDLALVVEKKVALHASFIILVSVAFLSGLLSFLSPCALPIFPAYFVNVFQTPERVLKHSFLFSAGFALVFGVLGMTVTFLSRLLVENTLLISRFAGVAVIGFSILTILGRGWSGVRVFKAPDMSSFGSVFFGASIAIAWSPCVGPVLGTLFVIAATSNTAVSGGFLLVLYALGFTLPLIFASLFLQRWGSRRFRSVLAGRTFHLRIFGRVFAFHSTSLIAGGLEMLLGVLMVTGILYSLNKYVVNTAAQKALFSIEGLLVKLLRME